MELRLRLKFEDVFPDEIKFDLNYYLEGISRSNLTRMASLLALISESDIEWNDWRKLILHKWFSSTNREFVKKIVFSIEKYEKENINKYESKKFSIINKLTALQLLEFVLSKSFLQAEYLDDSDSLEINLFKALLILNGRQDELENHYNKEVILNNDFSVTAMYIVYGLAQHEIINTSNFDLYKILAAQTIKSIFLFNFLEKFCPWLLDSFLSKYSCKNYKEYFDLIMPIVSQVFTVKPDLESDFFEIELPNSKLLNFIDKFVIRPGTLDEDVDFRNIRSMPILEISDKKYVIMSNLFMVQKIYNGLYFEFKKINDVDFDKKILNFRVYFTSYFTEKFLFYNLMDSAYSKRKYKRYSGEEIEGNYKFLGGPDYYVRNGNRILLFENKDILIASATKNSYSYNEISQILEDKLAKKKGINQVINNIRYILDKKYPFDNSYNKSVKIYPIIIVHNSEFNSLGINKFYNNIFKDRLNFISNEGYNINYVKDITIINIDILLIFQNSLQSKLFSLHEAIDMYHKSICTPFVNKTRIGYDKWIEKQNWSFGDFFYNEYIFKKNISFKYDVEYLMKEFLRKSLSS
jgi:hypothetical protein